MPHGEVAWTELFSRDISRAKQDFDWEPRFPIEEGIPDYIAWLRAHPQ